MTNGLDMSGGEYILPVPSQEDLFGKEDESVETTCHAKTMRTKSGSRR